MLVVPPPTRPAGGKHQSGREGGRMSEDGMRDSSFLLPRQCKHVGAPPTCSYMRMQERAGREEGGGAAAM